MANPLRWLRKRRAGLRKDPPAVVMGLGNPGEKYTRTRHNVGFRCVDLVAERAGIRFNDKRKHALVGQGSLGETEVVLAKPRTFMNHSGAAARYLADRFRAKPAGILVVIDDLDLPLGSIRLRAGGGSGGHNGLNSINAELGSQDYPRLRVGIGRPQRDAIQHVLAGFSEDEERVLEEAMARAADAVEAWAEHGIGHAMNLFN